MIHHKILALTLLTLAVSKVSAHSLWLEPAEGGHKVFFGEPDRGLREKKDKLEQFSGLKVWKAGGAEAKPVLNDDHLFVAGDGADLTAANLDSPVKEKPEGNVKSYRYLRFVSDIEKPGKPSKPLFLDIVPESKGLHLKVLKDGKPFEETAITVLAPNGWSRNIKTDKQGKLQIQAPWPGVYLVKASWKDKQTGEFGGKKFESVSHSIALSFVKP